MKSRLWTIPTGIFFLLVIIVQHRFFEFHTLTALLTVILSFIIFILAWLTKGKGYVENNLLLFLACGYLWVGSFDLMHFLVYKGMAGFVDESHHLSMQFSTVARYLQALLLFTVLFIVTRKQKNRYLLVTFFAFSSIPLFGFIWLERLPLSFIETEAASFTLYSEYLISFILMLVLNALFYREYGLRVKEKKLIIAAVIIMLCCEFIFIFNAEERVWEDNILKLFSLWLILSAAIISHFKNAHDRLRKGEENFKRLFENSEVSIWNEDLSEVLNILNKLRSEGVSNIELYLKENENRAWELAAKVKVLQVNEATLRLFGAKSKRVFFKRIDETFGTDALDVFIKGLHAIWEGKKTFRSESVYYTLDGREINCITSFSIPETVEDFCSIPVTLVDITQRKQDEARIWRQGNFDDLTGLVNRNLFLDRLSHALDHAKRNKTSVALLYLDLDGFKHVNDTLGHLIGDKLLQEASQRLVSHMRKSDTVARLGGDEFAVLLPEINNSHDIEMTVKKIQVNIARPYHFDGHDSFVSVSIGITIFPDDGTNTVTLLRKADSAMYRAKAKGRNNFQFFTQEIDEEAMRRKELEEALHMALDNGDFFIKYQPVINIETGAVESAEALIRWKHHEKGILLPSEFIPLAEEIGLIVPIGEWVLREACKEAVAWSITDNKAPSVSVNLSSCQFNRQNIPELVKQVLSETGLPATRLTLEITESLLLVNNKKILDQLQAICSLGVQLSIDDFGTGYSSLSYLKKFPVNTLKIDRSFIMNLPVAAEDVALVNAILAMAKSLGMKVVAEGVETKSQAEFIKSTQSCQYLQGYLYSKPLA
ncbi:MAG: EAL domain-containing protein, partial [Psychromonas sp.]|nr:EAL domain-containing protein [Psychromonas sp.]